MPIYFFHLLAPVIGLCFNVAVQLILCRLLKKKRLLKTIFAGFFMGFIPVLIIEAIYCLNIATSGIDCLGLFLFSVISYGALGYCYFHFVNLGETARRVRIVREMNAFEQGLTMADLTSRYNASEIIQARLKRMVSNKQVEVIDGRYFIGSPYLFYMAKLIVLIRLVLLKRRSEFETT